MGQLALEQARDTRADRMAIVEHDPGMEVAQALKLRRQRLVVRVEPPSASGRDARGVRPPPLAVERLAVEGRGRAQLRGRLAGIERNTRGVAVDVDHGA